MPATSRIGKRRKAAKADGKAPYQQRRKEIAEAAVRVFNQLGFQGASVSAVAAELNIDRASLYYYISSKEELFDEIVREVLENNAATTLRIHASKVSPPQKLRDFIIAMMKSFEEHYPLLFIYVRENLSHVSDRRAAWSRHMKQLNHQIESTVIAMIEEGYADGSFRNVGSARVVTYGIFGLLGWTHRWFRPERTDESGEEIGSIYADMVLAGLEPRQTADSRPRPRRRRSSAPVRSSRYGS